MRRLLRKPVTISVDADFYDRLQSMKNNINNNNGIRVSTRSITKMLAHNNKFILPQINLLDDRKTQKQKSRRY